MVVTTIIGHYRSMDKLIFRAEDGESQTKVMLECLDIKQISNYFNNMSITFLYKYNTSIINKLFMEIYKNKLRFQFSTVSG